MKAQTILLLCAAAIGAIAFHPSAASADIDFSIGSQGTSVCLGSCNPVPVYQPVIIEQRNSESRYREEERIREEHRLAENRERERFAEQRQRERFADQRQREQRTNERFADQRQREQRTDERRDRVATQTSSHVYSSNNNQQNNNNSSNNTRHYNR